MKLLFGIVLGLLAVTSILMVVLVGRSSTTGHGTAFSGPRPMFARSASASKLLETMASQVHAMDLAGIAPPTDDAHGAQAPRSAQGQPMAQQASSGAASCPPCPPNSCPPPPSPIAARVCPQPPPCPAGGGGGGGGGAAGGAAGMPTDAPEPAKGSRPLCLNGDAPGKVGRWYGNRWAPDTCLYHQYTWPEVKECFGKMKWVALIGDSVTRTMFETYIGHASPEDTAKYNQLRPKQHFDFDMQWQDAVRLSMRFIGMLYNDPTQALLEKMLSESPQPDAILFNSGLWDLNYPIDFPEYQRCVEDLVKLFKKYNYQGLVVWRDTTAVVDEKLDVGRKRKMHNGIISSYNHKARLNVVPAGWKVINGFEMSVHRPDLSGDGFHYHGAFNEAILNSFHNIACNELMGFTD